MIKINKKKISTSWALASRLSLLGITYNLEMFWDTLQKSRATRDRGEREAVDHSHSISPMLFFLTHFMLRAAAEMAGKSLERLKYFWNSSRRRLAWDFVSFRFLCFLSTHQIVIAALNFFDNIFFCVFTSCIEVFSCMHKELYSFVLFFLLLSLSFFFFFSSPSHSRRIVI